ncbi:hypothetical protein LINGRAHAP2_LOCUS3798 [Linum grandiflorum]
MSSLEADSSSRHSNFSRVGMIQSEQCSHRCEAIVKVAGTEKNRGRAFYRCRFWKDKSIDYGYFKWVDEQYAIGDVEMGSECGAINEGVKGCMYEFQCVRQKV